MLSVLMRSPEGHGALDLAVQLLHYAGRVVALWVLQEADCAGRLVYLCIHLSGVHHPVQAFRVPQQIEPCLHCPTHRPSQEH